MDIFGFAAQSATDALAPFRFERRDVKYRFVIDMASLAPAA